MNNSTLLRLGDAISEVFESLNGQSGTEVILKPEGTIFSISQALRKFLDDFDWVSASNGDLENFKRTTLSILVNSNGSKISDILTALCQRLRRPKQGDRISDRNKTPLILGPFSFTSRIELRKRVRRLFEEAMEQNTFDTDLPQAEFEFMRDLLMFHPRSEEKLENLSSIYIGSHPHSRHKTFFVRRSDGSDDDFSYIRCIEGVPSIEWEIQESICNLLCRVSKVFPSCGPHIVDAIKTNFPPVHAFGDELEAYTRCVIYLTRELPHLRLGFFRLIFKIMLDLDVAIRTEDLQSVHGVHQTSQTSSVFLAWKEKELAKVRKYAESGRMDFEVALSILEAPISVHLNKFKQQRTEEHFDIMASKLDALLCVLIESTSAFLGGDFSVLSSIVRRRAVESAALGAPLPFTAAHKIKTDPTSSNEIATTTDINICDKSEIQVKSELNSNQTKQPDTTKVVEELMMILKDSVLPLCQSLKCVQFIFFFVASRSPSFAEKILQVLFEALAKATQEANAPPPPPALGIKNGANSRKSIGGAGQVKDSNSLAVVSQRICISFISSLIARAAFLPSSFARVALTELIAECNEASKQGDLYRKKMREKFIGADGKPTKPCIPPGASAWSIAQLTKHHQQVHASLTVESSLTAFEQRLIMHKAALLQSICYLLLFCLPQQIRERKGDTAEVVNSFLHDGLEKELLADNGRAFSFIHFDVKSEFLVLCERLPPLQQLGQQLRACKFVIESFECALPLSANFAEKNSRSSIVPRSPSAFFGSRSSIPPRSPSASPEALSPTIVTNAPANSDAKNSSGVSAPPPKVRGVAYNLVEEWEKHSTLIPFDPLQLRHSAKFLTRLYRDWLEVNVQWTNLGFSRPSLPSLGSTAVATITQTTRNTAGPLHIPSSSFSSLGNGDAHSPSVVGLTAVSPFANVAANVAANPVNSPTSPSRHSIAMLQPSLLAGSNCKFPRPSRSGSSPRLSPRLSSSLAVHHPNLSSSLTSQILPQTVKIFGSPNTISPLSPLLQPISSVVPITPHSSASLLQLSSDNSNNNNSMRASSTIAQSALLSRVFAGGPLPPSHHAEDMAASNNHPTKCHTLELPECARSLSSPLLPPSNDSSTSVLAVAPSLSLQLGEPAQVASSDDISMLEHVSRLPRESIRQSSPSAGPSFEDSIGASLSRALAASPSVSSSSSSSSSPALDKTRVASQPIAVVSAETREAVNPFDLKVLQSPNSNTSPSPSRSERQMEIEEDLTAEGEMDVESESSVSLETQSATNESEVAQDEYLDAILQQDNVHQLSPRHSARLWGDDLVGRVKKSSRRKGEKKEMDLDSESLSPSLTSSHVSSPSASPVQRKRVKKKNNSSYLSSSESDDSKSDASDMEEDSEEGILSASNSSSMKISSSSEMSSNEDDSEFSSSSEDSFYTPILRPLLNSSPLSRFSSVHPLHSLSTSLLDSPSFDLFEFPEDLRLVLLESEMSKSNKPRRRNRTKRNTNGRPALFTSPNTSPQDCPMSDCNNSSPTIVPMSGSGKKKLKQKENNPFSNILENKNDLNNAEMKNAAAVVKSSEKKNKKKKKVPFSPLILTSAHDALLLQPAVSVPSLLPRASASPLTASPPLRPRSPPVISEPPSPVLLARRSIVRTGFTTAAKQETNAAKRRRILSNKSPNTKPASSPINAPAANFSPAAQPANHLLPTPGSTLASVAAAAVLSPPHKTIGNLLVKKTHLLSPSRSTTTSPISVHNNKNALSSVVNSTHHVGDVSRGNFDESAKTITSTDAQVSSNTTTKPYVKSFSSPAVMDGSSHLNKNSMKALCIGDPVIMMPSSSPPASEPPAPPALLLKASPHSLKQNSPRIQPPAKNNKDASPPCASQSVPTTNQQTKNQIKSVVSSPNVQNSSDKSSPPLPQTAVIRVPSPPPPVLVSSTKQKPQQSPVVELQSKKTNDSQIFVELPPPPMSPSVNANSIAEMDEIRRRHRPPRSKRDEEAEPLLVVPSFVFNRQLGQVLQKQQQQEQQQQIAATSGLPKKPLNKKTDNGAVQKQPISHFNNGSRLNSIKSGILLGSGSSTPLMMTPLKLTSTRDGTPLNTISSINKKTAFQKTINGMENKFSILQDLTNEFKPNPVAASSTKQTSSIVSNAPSPVVKSIGVPSGGALGGGKKKRRRTMSDDKDSNDKNT